MCGCFEGFCSVSGSVADMAGVQHWADTDKVSLEESAAPCRKCCHTLLTPK